MDAFLPSQPESYKKLIKRSLILYRASFSKVVLLTFLLSITVFIPRLISDTVGQEIFINLPPLSPHRLWMIAISLASLLFFIAILWHIHCVIRGVHEPLIEDFYVGMKKTLYVFVAAILLSAILFIAMALIYGLIILLNQYHVLFASNAFGVVLTVIAIIGQTILTLYVFTLFFFYVPLIAIENKGIFTSLERSILLVWNHWWRTFSVQMTPWFYYFILLIIFRFVLNINIHIYFLEYGSHPIWTTFLHIILFALFIPWVAALLLIQLNDLELRRELAHKPR